MPLKAFTSRHRESRFDMLSQIRNARTFIDEVSNIISIKIVMNIFAVKEPMLSMDPKGGIWMF